MAALIKLRHTTLLQRCGWNYLNLNRGISTTPKYDAATNDKNWVSYGFDEKCQTDDYNAHHGTFFFSVSLCLVFGGFCWAYAPDIHMRDWAQREAFLQLHLREKGKKPLISPNYVESVKIPSEKDICDMEIII